MFKGVKNFLSAAFMFWAKPVATEPAPESSSEPPLILDTPAVYDPVFDISVGEVLPWPSMQGRDDLLEICENIQTLLIDSQMSLASEYYKGALDLLLVMTREGVKLQAYHANTAQRRELIKPIDIAPFDPEDDDSLVLSAVQTFEAFKERGFTFEEEEPARLALGILSQTINIEANRPEVMRRSDILRAASQSSSFPKPE
ncbi:MAG: hypothetical protein DI586_02575 [Micavibrio aeruginosavorus]|uniref:Uncharacterized protein n=1 Tax=Micavibrio aeruginosavorus TaxID=349221 RepID=A0A2W5FPA5_9BACT|nr:MAG: hypothetical protein DI586_02575 [Micavibrio aeruginosavorus]